MGFESGHKKLGGRKTGTPNKANQIIREIVEAAIGGKTIPARMLELAKGNPVLELDVLKGFLPYCYAKLAPIEGAKGNDMDGVDNDELESLICELQRVRSID